MIIRENISLKKFNTFGIDVVAKHFATFDSTTILAEISEDRILNIYHSTLNTKHPTQNIILLGGGSNILFTKNVDGLVLKNEIAGIEKIDEDDDCVYIRSGAGEAWHQFVLYCLKHNLAGAENLALIPGSVGASPMQNIGAYGVEVKDIFHSLEAYDLGQNKMVAFNNNDCEFGYRDSVFKKSAKGKYIICSVTFRLNKKPVFHTSYGAITQELDNMKIKDLSIQGIAQAVINIRRSKLPDPLQIGNAGSFFKNPEVDYNTFLELKARDAGIISYNTSSGNMKLAAGWLIEQCGWKGFRKGDAGCHEKQALVLVNYGHATGSQIYDLSSEILASVHRKFGIQLEREVNII